MSLLANIAVPSSALRWGVLTTETYAWHVDRLRYVWAHASAAVAEPVVPVIRELVFIATGMADTVSRILSGEPTA